MTPDEAMEMADLRCEIGRLRGDRAAVRFDLARLGETLREVRAETRRFIADYAALREALRALPAQWATEAADLPAGPIGAAAGAVLRLCAGELRAALEDRDQDREAARR